MISNIQGNILITTVWPMCLCCRMKNVTIVRIYGHHMFQILNLRCHQKIRFSWCSCRIVYAFFIPSECISNMTYLNVNVCVFVWRINEKWWRILNSIQLKIISEYYLISRRRRSSTLKNQLWIITFVYTFIKYCSFSAYPSATALF